MDRPIEEWIKSLPGLRNYRKAKYRRRFEREGTHNLFYGVYSSFADALSDVPENRELGYDNPGSALLYEDHLARIWPEHYPVLFWLSRSWGAHQRVLDFGGHRGALFYATRRWLGAGPEWYVFDVPAVVEEGRRWAHDHGVERLTFESDLSRIPAPDLVVAAGSLQYVEESPLEWLERIPGEPRYLLVSTTPFHPDREFVTLNNMGTAYCPYKVRHFRRFFEGLHDLGYATVEQWHHPGKACNVPFHIPPGEVTYRGALFERGTR